METVTVAVVPRDHFSDAVRSLDSILQHTAGPYELIYVDGFSPPKVREAIEERAHQHQFTVLRSAEYLTPNEARNIALSAASSRYIVFIDNDVTVSDGWLRHLVDCAEETNAGVVAPAISESSPNGEVIHCVGGDAGFHEEEGQRTFFETHPRAKEPARAVLKQLERRQVGLVEFHAVLVRASVFDSIGPLDEKLMTACEHTDLCLRTREAGYSIYVEPRSRVCFSPPIRIGREDMEFFNLRWGYWWNRRTLEHLAKLWDLEPDNVGLLRLEKFLGTYRRRERRFRTKWQKLVPRYFARLWDRMKQARTAAASAQPSLSSRKRPSVTAVVHQ